MVVNDGKGKTPGRVPLNGVDRNGIRCITSTGCYSREGGGAHLRAGRGKQKLSPAGANGHSGKEMLRVRDAPHRGGNVGSLWHSCPGRPGNARVSPARGRRRSQHRAAGRGHTNTLSRNPESVEPKGIEGRGRLYINECSIPIIGTF